MWNENQFLEYKIFVFRFDKKSKHNHTDKLQRKLTRFLNVLFVGGCTQNWRNMHEFRLDGITEFWLHVSFPFVINFHSIHIRNHFINIFINKNKVYYDEWKMRFFFLAQSLVNGEWAYSKWVEWTNKMRFRRASHCDFFFSSALSLCELLYEAN